MIRLLLAEDHGLLRAGLRSMLESTGDISIVAEAESAPQAVAQARREQPDVIVLDLALGASSALNAVRELLAERPGLGIVLICDHNGPRVLQEAIKAGVRGCLSEDSATAELLTAVREVYAGRRYLPPSVAASLFGELIEGTSAAGVRASGFEQLSSREREVLRYLAEGKTSSEIAIILGISQHTVDTHRRHTMSKLGLSNIVEVVKFAIRHGLVDLDD